MAFLEELPDDQKDLIIALPYRAGLWVSVCDNTGGSDADEDEIAALKDIISKKAQGMFESAFVHEVMSEISLRESQWKDWQHNLDKVPQECERAIKIIKEKLSERDVDAYRHNVMAIGVEVAKAFREFDADAPFWAKVDTKIRMFLEGMMRILKREGARDMESELNISYEEDKALSDLSEALHPEVKNAA